MQVWKFELHAEGFVWMPEGSKALSVDTQFEQPCLWALVDPAKPEVERKFVVVGTGHVLPDHGEFVGTFMLEAGRLVFHVFEEAENASTG